MTIDPISNMLISLKNGSTVRRASVVIPLSKMKIAIAETLQRAGFVHEVHAKGKKENKSDKFNFNIELAYTKDGAPKINGVSRISKLSRRVYAGAGEIRGLRRGKPGLLVISTPQGIMTTKEAIAAKVGGEVLFAIW